MKILKVKCITDVPKNYTGIVEFPNGTKEYWLNGKLHREDGPAIEYPEGLKYWILNGELHREDGPAVEYSNGNKEYYLNGENLNKEKIEQLIKLGYPESAAIKLSSMYNPRQLRE